MKHKKEHPSLQRAPKAYLNSEFLNGPSARSIRILTEYLYPEQHFKKSQVTKTIIFFGSARIPSQEQYERDYNDLVNLINEAEEMERELLMKKLDLMEKRKKYIKYYEDAQALAQLITEWTHQYPPDQRFVICSGGGPGIMEAANRGAYECGGDNVGLNISLPFEQNPNPYITPYLNFEFHYFFMRKYWFMDLAQALIVFPGGFGTMDELFELLTLVQTRKIEKPLPILLYGERFWKKIINFPALVEAGMISEEDLNLFAFVNTPEQAFAHLSRELARLHEL